MGDVLEDIDRRVCYIATSSVSLQRVNPWFRRMIPYPISDSIWLTNGSLLVGAGHQMLLYGQPNKGPSPTGGRSDSLFEYAARQNGPLEDYHPQMLLQCLLWGTMPSACLF